MAESVQAKAILDIVRLSPQEIEDQRRQTWDRIPVAAKEVIIRLSNTVPTTKPGTYPRWSKLTAEQKNELLRLAKTMQNVAEWLRPLK